MELLHPALNAGHHHEAQGLLLTDVHVVHEAVDDMHGDWTVLHKIDGVLIFIEGNLQVVDHRKDNLYTQNKNRLLEPYETFYSFSFTPEWTISLFGTAENEF
jgi:hypothetical protein